MNNTTDGLEQGIAVLKALYPKKTFHIGRSYWQHNVEEHSRYEWEVSLWCDCQGEPVVQSTKPDLVRAIEAAIAAKFAKEKKAKEMEVEAKKEAAKA